MTTDEEGRRRRLPHRAAPCKSRSSDKAQDKDETWRVIVPH